MSSAFLLILHLLSCHHSACCARLRNSTAGHSNAPEARAQPVSRAPCASWSALFLAMFSSTRRLSSACSLGLYPTAKRPSIQANRPASTRLCSSTRYHPQCITDRQIYLQYAGTCSIDQQTAHHGNAAFQAAHIPGASKSAAQRGVAIKIRPSSLHLEEAVEEGRLAVLNHDVPNLNLHRTPIVSP